ncbi:MAG: putative fluoride ion transporter CrcB [Candidatus Thorarchaeota archaeon]|nr:MAG: putative fluoride ion transporter CrcB [Candidatus Thorarchaeota archaeon]
MLESILIAVGAFFGAISRVFVSKLSEDVVVRELPVATIAVNILGSFCLGILIPVITISDLQYWFIVIGFLSSFTTFSSFVMEINNLWNVDKMKSVEYASYSLLFGFIVLSLGLVIGNQLLIT